MTDLGTTNQLLLKSWPVMISDLIVHLLHLPLDGCQSDSILLDSSSINRPFWGRSLNMA